jgi:hypothetical protein
MESSNAAKQHPAFRMHPRLAIPMDVGDIHRRSHIYIYYIIYMYIIGTYVINPIIKHPQYI